MGIKKTKLKEINLIPMRDTLITTANVVKKDTSIIMGPNDRPAFLNVQQVLAVGPTVNSCEHCEEIKVGDWIYLDLSQYLRKVRKQSDAIAGVGGGKYEVEELHAPIFAAPGDTDMTFKISVREIDGVVKSYRKLPKYMKSFQTVEEFLMTQEKLRKASDKAARQFNNKKVEDEVVEEGKDYPAVVTEGNFRA